MSKVPYIEKKCSILNWGIAPHWTKTIFQDPSSQGQATPWRGRPSSPGSDLASFAVDGHCTKITTLLHHITLHPCRVTLHSITSHYYLYYLIYTVLYSQYIQYIYIKHHIPSLEQTGSISPSWGSTNKSSVYVSFRSKMHCNWEQFAMSISATAAQTSDKSQADSRRPLKNNVTPFLLGSDWNMMLALRASPGFSLPRCSSLILRWFSNDWLMWSVTCCAGIASLPRCTKSPRAWRCSWHHHTAQKFYKSYAVGVLECGVVSTNPSAPKVLELVSLVPSKTNQRYSFSLGGGIFKIDRPPKAHETVA